jgi:Lrp/AsnC family transcriptional regulator
LSTHGRAHPEEFTAAIRNFRQVPDCQALMCSADFLVRVLARNISIYERSFFAKLSRQPGIQ